jgi:FkbM family methyltransferase
MGLASFLYAQTLAARGAAEKVWAFLRKAAVLLLGDPVCTVPVHGRPLRMRLSHAMPLLLQRHRFYDRLPARVSAHFHARQASIGCIDVGANIGDTVAAFRQSEADRFLAIEANARFYDLLVQNWGRDPQVQTVAVLCSSESGEGKFEIREKRGTAVIAQTEHGQHLQKQPLDAIVAAHPAVGQVDILKIDTDGHDFEVIRGAAGVIAQHRPAVLFECDPADNPGYVADCTAAIALFRERGYRHFLLYDNLGHLLGQYSLEHPEAFYQLLFYQLTSPLCYFDILVMKDEDLIPFHQQEIEYFAKATTNPALQRSVAAAVTLAR